MTEYVEFGTKATADSYREEYPEYLCSDDDRRLKTVAFTSDTPDSVLERARLEADDGRAERAESTGQADLSDHELNEIDFTEGRASVPHAMSVKGIAVSEGVDDWLAYYDPTLTVDEHREVMAQAAQEGGGLRMDTGDSATERAGRAARRAQSEECDHARGHCEHGEPEACEFLQEQCGYDEEEIQLLLTDERLSPEDSNLVTVGGGEFPEMQVPAPVAGALKRSWTGYREALRNLSNALEVLEDEIRNGRQAIRAINAINEEYGGESVHPDGLHDILASLDELPQSIPEVRTLHHFSGTSHEREDVIEKDAQQTLGGDRAEAQTRLAGGETGSPGQGEVEQVANENPGGLLADEREAPREQGETEQQVPDYMNVAEGGQRTL